VPGHPTAEVTADRPRRVLGRRALGLGIVALVLISGMTVLGFWQLSVFDDRQQRDGEKQLEREPVPISEVMGPDDAYPADAVGRPVLVEGRYVDDEEVYVARLAGHDDAFAVVTPLLDGTGSAVLVVRGSTDEPDQAPPAPAGRVEVTGILEPSTPEGDALDDRRVTNGLRIAALVAGFGTDLYSGYVVLTESNPAETLPPVEPPIPEPSLLAGLRNLAYALQWWVFAGFVAFMWWRIVREDEPFEEGAGGSGAAQGVG
jgi:cytochrome oxidase assembly protein ShyY1